MRPQQRCYVRRSALTLFAVLLCAGVSPRAPAAVGWQDMAAEQLSDAGFREDYRMELDRFESRLLLLAREIPPDVYATRLEGGTHTLEACLEQLVAGHRRIVVGLERKPSGVETASESGAKTRIIAQLEAALGDLRAALRDEDDLERPIDYLGRRWTARALFLLALAQGHEFLGHAAADAEARGYPPRWVRERRVAEESID